MSTVSRSKPAGVQATLNSRAKRYGKFSEGAQVMQDLKSCIRFHLEQREKKLPANQQEALEMICHKIGRIINGDELLADSWHDVAGYATLVDDQLNGYDH